MSSQDDGLDEVNSRLERLLLEGKTANLRAKSKLPEDETERVLSAYTRASEANIRIGVENRRRIREGYEREVAAILRSSSTSLLSWLRSWISRRD